MQFADFASETRSIRGTLNTAKENITVNISSTKSLYSTPCRVYRHFVQNILQYIDNNDRSVTSLVFSAFGSARYIWYRLI